MSIAGIGCRVFQWVFNLGAKLLPWRKALRVEGPGSIAKIPEILSTNNVTKPLVVTDPGLVKAGIVSRVLDILSGAEIASVLYSGVEANPSLDTVNAIQKMYFDEACDGFIALGGGSSIDAAKAAAARVARPEKSVRRMGGLLTVLRALPPFIAVPTTSGTGSETTIAALVTDTETHHKYAIMDICLIPKYAVLDPDVTLDLPPALTATTGMDALTHAVEAWLCWTYSTAESRGFALDAVKLVFQNLEEVYRNGKNAAARLAMMVASYKAGFAFTRAGVGNVHAIAHTLGGLYNTPHGLANAVILPVVLEDYGKAVHTKLARLAEAAGLVAADAVCPDAEKARVFIDSIYKMNERMGIPRGFDFIRDEDIPAMINWAIKECNPLYPVPVIYDKKRFRNVIERVKKNGERASHSIDDACTGCTLCARGCPVFAITGTKGGRHFINAARCVNCGICGELCPSRAVRDERGIRVEKKKKRPKPVIARELCSACSLCVQFCTRKALRISSGGERGDIRAWAELAFPEKCTGCALCGRYCPLGAVSFTD